MSGILILIIIVGTGIGALTFFVLRSLLAPRKVDGIAELLKGGKSQAAIRLARRILTREPHNPDAHYLLGEAYLSEGKAELALMELKLINQAGRFGRYCREVPFRKRAAELYRRFRQGEEALKEYLLLVRLEPANAEHYFQAGQLLEERQHVDKAFLYYKKAEQLDIQHLGVHLRLGSLLYRQKKLAEAQVQMESALRLDPENLPAHYTLGRILKAMRDYPAALRSLEKAQRDPQLRVKALIEAGTCHLSLNDLNRATPVLERAADLTAADGGEENLYARYFLALCYEKSRELEKAIGQWEAIHTRNPAFRDVARKLAQYQELRIDDRMKDYLTASAEEFQQICRRLLAALNLKPRDMEQMPEGVRVTAVEAAQSRRSIRPVPQAVLFLRESEGIDVSTVRSLHEFMKKQNLGRGTLINGGSFTRRAVEFAETRPIDLIDLEKLSTLLSRAPADG